MAPRKKRSFSDLSIKTDEEVKRNSEPRIKLKKQKLESLEFLDKGDIIKTVEEEIDFDAIHRQPTLTKMEPIKEEKPVSFVSMESSSEEEEKKYNPFN